MMEFRQGVMRGVLLLKRGIPISADIMAEELFAHFRRPRTLAMEPPTQLSTSISLKAQQCWTSIPMFPSSKKCWKSAISFFGVKQEEKDTLKAYIEHFHKVILEILVTHLEVLLSAITQGLRNGPLFESLAKKSVSNFYDLLARADSYINLEDAQLTEKNIACNRSRDNEKASSHKSRGEPI
ncbi:UNVERIFIED_CONTAM: hypothetical protein Slati_4437600 [Sesamum latifolium]|uniref:Retrotransposon gag domain-containing protein n=1 Tax=Sesamum latifolium TaxID=2727402 RepID=A0AAW2SRQ3_9LAMI